MAIPWTHKLSERINNVPLIIAGPILRRTKSNSVSVFLALKESKTVTLKIYRRDGTLKFSGTKATTSLGTHLHVVVVTAAPDNEDNNLQPNFVYKYDIEFNSSSTKLSTPGVLQVGGNGLWKIKYGSDDLPTFSLPPSNIEHLRILQASCRKPHGEMTDVFSGMDDILTDSIVADDYTTAIRRPHQLYLTGDQIYADDVAYAMLYMIRDAMGQFFPWHEALPGVSSTHENLGYGKRAAMISGVAKFSRVDFSTDAKNSRRNHLIFLAEYFTMYLFVWSPELWPDEDHFPSYNNLPGASSDIQEDFNTERTQLKTFRAGLAKVRKILANIPTYMIFDDHEITDDWFLNLHWCNDAFSSSLGKRIMQNGMTAYAVFQAWGNTSWRFDDINEAGGKLLYDLNQNATADDFDANVPNLESTTYWERFAQLVGMPSLVNDSSGLHKKLKPHSAGIKWSYTLEFPYFQVIVIDTRTMREYPWKTVDGYPSLLSRDDGLDQLDAIINSSTYKFYLIVSPAPVMGVPRTEWWQKDFTGAMSIIGTPTVSLYQERDSEAWGLQERGFERFIGKIGDKIPNGRVVFLSGDVHYGFAARMEHWATNRFGSTSTVASHMVLAQLTASSLHNEKGGNTGSLVLHHEGWRYTGANGIEHPSKVVGYNHTSSQPLLIGQGTNTMAVGSTSVDWNVSAEDGKPAISNFSKETEVRTAPSGPLTLNQTPHWQYRIDYFSDESVTVHPAQSFTAQGVDPPPSGSRTAALKQYLKAASNSGDYNLQWGYGKEIVGKNNFGEVRFEWGTEENEKFIKFSIWWRLQGSKSTISLLDPFPLTNLVIPMGKSLPSYPKPENDLN